MSWGAIAMGVIQGAGSMWATDMRITKQISDYGKQITQLQDRQTLLDEHKTEIIAEIAAEKQEALDKVSDGYDDAKEAAQTAYTRAEADASQIKAETDRKARAQYAHMETQRTAAGEAERTELDRVFIQGSQQLQEQTARNLSGSAYSMYAQDIMAAAEMGDAFHSGEEAKQALGAMQAASGGRQTGQSAKQAEILQGNIDRGLGRMQQARDLQQNISQAEMERYSEDQADVLDTMISKHQADIDESNRREDADIEDYEFTRDEAFLSSQFTYDETAEDAMELQTDTIDDLDTWLSNMEADIEDDSSDAEAEYMRSYDTKSAQLEDLQETAEDEAKYLEENRDALVWSAALTGAPAVASGAIDLANKSEFGAKEPAWEWDGGDFKSSGGDDQIANGSLGR
jgi:hypothetical protein